MKSMHAVFKYTEKLLSSQRSNQTLSKNDPKHRIYKSTHLDSNSLMNSLESHHSLATKRGSQPWLLININSQRRQTLRQKVKDKITIPHNKSMLIVYALAGVNFLLPLFLLLKKKRKKKYKKITSWSLLWSNYELLVFPGLGAQWGDAHCCNSNICVSNTK